MKIDCRLPSVEELESGEKMQIWTPSAIPIEGCHPRRHEPSVGGGHWVLAAAKLSARATTHRPPPVRLIRISGSSFVIYYITNELPGGALFYADEGEDFIAREPALGRQAVRGAIAEDFR